LRSDLCTSTTFVTEEDLSTRVSGAFFDFVFQDLHELSLYIARSGAVYLIYFKTQ
jgi:serine phosphatase RsbU (regulator of sigma subunit)